MKRTLTFGFLVGANLVLAGLLVLGARERNGTRTLSSRGDAEPPTPSLTVDHQLPVQSFAKNRRTSVSKHSVPATPFTRMYSPDAKSFATNLRGIGCPEETVKDILMAEISRRYHTQEEALRPKPADHVPFTWSANPSERKLFQRRQQAAAIARQKAAALLDALGYDVPVAMPVYAMTRSEQRFEDSLATLTPEQRSAVVRAQEDYWARVQSLQDRTKGFWQSEDVAELEQLKQERKELIGNLRGGQ